MKIIVLAHPKDDHAAPVCWALEQAGYQTACWSGLSPDPQDQASLLMDEHSCITLGTHRLENDDVLLIFSDGVTEAFNAAGEEFGEERMLACLHANHDREPAVLLQKLLAAVQEFAASAAQSDDVTALVLKYRRLS